MYKGDFTLGDTIDFKFNTVSAGVPFTLAGTPSLAAYVDNGTTQITAGLTLTVDFDGKTGLNNVRVVASGANGFAAGTNVSIQIEAGTVDGNSVVGMVVGEFSIENRSAVNPVTKGRKIAIDSSNNVTVAAMASGSITSATLAASAITAIQSGLSTLDSADILAEIDAALNATIADSVAADGSRPSIRQGILMLTRFLMERNVSGVTMTVAKENGTTASMTFTLNDATNPTSITRAS